MKSVSREDYNKIVFDKFIKDNKIKPGDIFFWGGKYTFGAIKVVKNGIDTYYDFVNNVENKCILIHPGDVLLYIKHLEPPYTKNVQHSLINLYFLYKKDLVIMPVVLNDDKNIILAMKYIYDIIPTQLENVLKKQNI